MTHTLFVYGSLRAAVKHPMAEVLREHGEPAGLARVRGRLYAVGGYPGLVVDPHAGWVVGELWTDLQPDVWPLLDFYEGCSAEDPQPHEYVRRITTVESGVQAWIYDYALDVATLSPVPSGDWLKR